MGRSVFDALPVEAQAIVEEYQIKILNNDRVFMGDYDVVFGSMRNGAANPDLVLAMSHISTHDSRFFSVDKKTSKKIITPAGDALLTYLSERWAAGEVPETALDEPLTAEETGSLPSPTP